MSTADMKHAPGIRSLSDTELEQVSGGAESRYSEMYMKEESAMFFGLLGFLLGKGEKGTLNSLNR